MNHDGIVTHCAQFSPDLFIKPVLADDLPCVFGQIQKNTKLPGSQPKLPPILINPAAIHINFQPADPYAPAGSSLCRFIVFQPPELGLDAKNQFLWAEGFGDIVIPTAAEPENFIHIIIPRRQKSTGQ